MCASEFVYAHYRFYLQLINLRHVLKIIEIFIYSLGQFLYLRFFLFDLEFSLKSIWRTDSVPQFYFGITLCVPFLLNVCGLGLNNHYYLPELHSKKEMYIK